MTDPTDRSVETFKTNSLEQTHKLGRELATRLTPGDCLALIGPLGAGKTALVKGIAQGLGLTDERLVSSPTYVLVQEYPGRTAIYHVDLYRLAVPAMEIADLGLEEMLADGVVLIEWADRAAGTLPRPRWELEIEITGPNSRKCTLTKID